MFFTVLNPSSYVNPSFGSGVTLTIVSVSPFSSFEDTFMYSPSKFISYTSTVYLVSLFDIQFAINVLFPVVPFSIVTILLGVSPLLPVQPSNVYPILIGLFNVKFSVSTVYSTGFVMPSSN